MPEIDDDDDNDIDRTLKESQLLLLTIAHCPLTVDLDSTDQAMWILIVAFELFAVKNSDTLIQNTRIVAISC